MKEKIERFSRGDFEYELPYICLSEEEIRITAEAGKVIEGTFTISNSMKRPMRGIIYSSISLLKIDNPVYHEAENTINYRFSAEYCREGDTISGELYIVSDCGDKTVPFSVQIEVSYCMTSLGKIKDLFQFTNLARMDWSEAKKVFRSEDFERIFLNNEERYKFIYKNLLKSVSTSQALEEFLVAIHKKSVIRLEIDKTRLEYHSLQENISDKLILTKNNWGYAEIRVSTDEAFIQLEQKFLWADRFIGNTHQVSFTIDPRQLKNGNNFGHIHIKTAHQTITVEILCRHKKEDRKQPENRLRRKAEIGLIDNYLNFRLDRIDLAGYLEEAEAMLKHLPGPEVSRIRELMKIHLSIVAGKTKITEELLSDLTNEVPTLKKKAPLEYCAYLYLDALYRKEEAAVNFAAENIRRYYVTGNGDWRILWFLLYIDKGYERNPAAKLSDIKEQFEAGCRSPIMYYEAVCIFNEEPFLIRELTAFEIQVLNYGIKNWILSKEAAQQYIYLANKKKTFDQVVFNNLEKLYDEYQTEEILFAICCTLIKGMKRSEKYFEWFRLGVDSQLRITELYEYYMYSISDTYQDLLAQPVLLYFIYNSSLSDRKKAFLYANIVRNKEKNEPIYRTYYKRMEIFASKMLEGHIISRDLTVLYKEFLNRGLQSADLARHLPYVMYRNELSCVNPNIVNAIILHKELGTEETVQLSNGRVQVDIYTDNAEVFLVDSFGNRYVESVEYNVKPFMNPEDYESLCVDHSNNPMLLLHLFSRYQSYRILNESSIALRKKVLLMDGLSKECATLCCQTLIEYYYENYNDELLEDYLNMLDLNQVRPAERAKYIEYMILRTFYDKALTALETFGLEGVPINKLIRLCSGWLIAAGPDKKNEFMADLCYYVFTQKKYDETILKYLVKYYNGATRDMFRLWQAAGNFELDTHVLEERLLTQMLFSEGYVEDSCLVFDTYYKAVSNHLLVRAYLSFFAYRYLVHDTVISPELIPVMKRELYYEENDICLLAWLKFNASNSTLADNELIFAEYNIERLIRKGIILPFYLEYRNRITLPDRILGRCYISYNSDPGKQVYIHYRLLRKDEQDFVTERMPDIFMGIHCKEFTLFYHEEIQYFITEESAEGTNITESLHLQYECQTPEDDESKYNQINLMLIASEMKDDQTLLDMMEGYIKREYLVDACFKQI